MRRSLKGLVNAIASFLVLPAVLLYRISARTLGPEQAFPGWAQAFALLPGLIGVALRRAFYCSILPRCGPDTWIGFGSVLSHPTAEIGRRVYVGVYCCLGDVTLEDDVLLGSHVSIMNGGAQHGIERLDVPIREQPGSWVRVSIGPDSWIGEHAVVMADVGRHCVVGAGSVVTLPIPDYAIAVGSPARVKRYRDGRDPNACPRSGDEETRAVVEVPSPQGIQ
jgi:acetyltransferase-like isoleucine patch superfamily enzyme